MARRIGGGRCTLEEVFLEAEDEEAAEAVAAETAAAETAAAETAAAEKSRGRPREVPPPPRPLFYPLPSLPIYYPRPLHPRGVHECVLSGPYSDRRSLCCSAPPLCASASGVRRWNLRAGQRGELSRTLMPTRVVWPPGLLCVCGGRTRVRGVRSCREIETVRKRGYYVAAELAIFAMRSRRLHWGNRAQKLICWANSRSPGRRSGSRRVGGGRGIARLSLRLALSVCCVICDIF